MTTTQAPPEKAVSRARRLPLPVTEPPFDDELGIVTGWERVVAGPGGGRRRGEVPGQGLLPLELDPDLGLVEPPAAGLGGRWGPSGPAGLGTADSLWLRRLGPEPPDPRRAASARARPATTPPPAATAAQAPTTAAVVPAVSAGDGLPDPRRWIARLAQSALECLHGRRSVQQLVRWTDEPVYRALARRAGEQEATPAERPRIRSLRVCRVSARVAEASVVVQLGEATRAVTVRLEADDGRWLCTAFDLVEPGPPRRKRRQRAAQASSKATA